MEKPITNLINNSGRVYIIFDGSLNKIGRASSLQAKNTANVVPKVILSFMYKSDATTDTPHCGIKPAVAPKIGDIFLCFSRR